MVFFADLVDLTQVSRTFAPYYIVLSTTFFRKVVIRCSKLCKYVSPFSLQLHKTIFTTKIQFHNFISFAWTTFCRYKTKVFLIQVHFIWLLKGYMYNLTKLVLLTEKKFCLVSSKNKSTLITNILADSYFSTVIIDYI